MDGVIFAIMIVGAAISIGLWGIWFNLEKIAKFCERNGKLERGIWE